MYAQGRHLRWNSIYMIMKADDEGKEEKDECDLMSVLSIELSQGYLPVFDE